MKNAEYELYNNLFPDAHNSLSFGTYCSLCNKSFNFIGQEIIWGNGARNAKIMIVGRDSAGGDKKERLWKGSIYTHMPLTNKKSGAKIRIMLYKIGINPHEVFFTNTVKCNVGYQNKLSYGNLVPICGQHLLKEFKIIKPEIVICLGRGPYKIISGIVKEYDTGLSLDQCKYLEHPSRIEGEKRETEYLIRIKHILYDSLNMKIV